MPPHATSPGPSSLPPPPPPPPDAHAVRRWGLGDAFASLGVYLGAAVVIAVAFVVAEGQDASLVGPWLPAFVLLPQVAALAYVFVAVARKGRGVVADLDLRVERPDIGIGVGIAFAGLIAAGIVGGILSAILGEDPNAAVADLVEESQGGGGITVWIVLVAVLGATLVPLSEEIVFRGLWWKALTKRGISPTMTLWITSLVFTLFHLEPLRSPVLLTLGLALGMGRLWTGRLAASLIAHGLINGLAFTVLVVELA